MIYAWAVVNNGWKVHAVVTATDDFNETKNKLSLCGIKPDHGEWLIDNTTSEHCKHCTELLLRVK